MEENKEQIELNEEQKKDLIKVLLRNSLEEKRNQDLDNQNKVELLKRLKALYEMKNELLVGDLIKWKSQLKNKKLPEYNEPAIILEILDEPIYDTKAEIGSTYFNEKFDIKVGVFRDNSFLTFYFDSNRFEKFE